MLHLTSPSRLLIIVALFLATGFLTGFHEGHSSFTLTSPAFKNGQPIPLKYAKDGDNLCPKLKIHGTPEGTQSLALIMNDPDAPNGNWIHYLLWNISPNTEILPEGEIAINSRIGKNSWGNESYDGPAPPSGKHRYIFTLYALDAHLDDLAQGSTAEQLQAAMKDHILAQTQLKGTFKAKTITGSP